METKRPTTDAEQVVAVATDYLTSFYPVSGTAEERKARVGRAAHVDLAKRSPAYMQEGMFLNMSYSELGGVAEREPAHDEPNPIPYSVQLLDMTPRMASVRTDARWGVDYIHLAKLNGDWKIVNVLWDDVT